MSDMEQVISELLYMKRDYLDGSEQDETLDKAVELIRFLDKRCCDLLEEKIQEARRKISGLQCETNQEQMLASIRQMKWDD